VEKPIIDLLEDSIHPRQSAERGSLIEK
jgi:hypothetical protein